MVHNGNADLLKYVKKVYAHNDKLEGKDPHREFLKEYRKLMLQNEAVSGDCSIGNYCGYGGCYRWTSCDIQDKYPKSRELAFQLERLRDQIGAR